VARIPHPAELAWRLPATLVNGLSIGAGLMLTTGVVSQTSGLQAAAAFASGFGSVCVADNVCPPRAKLAAMVPAGLSSMLVTLLVALSQGHAGWTAATVLGVVFVALLWTAWGKRGMPQSFAMIISVIFQLAAFSEAPMNTSEAARHLGWVATGICLMVGWSQFTGIALAQRYRTLALADSLANLAHLIGTQARWTQEQASPSQADSSDTLNTPSQQRLLSMIRQQSALADVFQSTRDLLYSEAHSTDERVHHQIDALIQGINLRDVLLSCQLDIEQIKNLPGAPESLRRLADYLTWHSQHLQRVAQALQLGTPLPDAGEPPALPHDQPDTHLQALARRALHLNDYRVALDNTLRGQACGPRPTAPQLQTFVSPTEWSWAPLQRQLSLNSPVMRYALRTTLAVACALALSRILPWHSHPHWLLLTVAVVLRGNLEQTLVRRNARVIGTTIGCLLVSLLLAAQPGALVLFTVLALAQSVAHGYVNRNYRVTAASAAVMALIQVHMFAHGTPSSWPDVAVRLADTLLGAGIAWGFSYVLPSWERGQLPALVNRLRQAQLAYAEHVLRWHEVHPRSPQRNHARREVYDTIWLLAQAVQRIGKEPAYAGSWSPQLEPLLIRSHRLTSHLAAVRIMLTRRVTHLEPTAMQAALRQTEAALARSLGTQKADQAEHHDLAGEPPEAPNGANDLPSPTSDPTPWLQRRLRLIEFEAQAWAEAAASITPKPKA
jgi:uncharacterized membrane protein YccC